MRRDVDALPDPLGELVVRFRTCDQICEARIGETSAVVGGHLARHVAVAAVNQHVRHDLAQVGAAAHGE
jgi:hypothetical protein